MIATENTMHDDKLMSVAEAARRLNLTAPTVRKHLATVKPTPGKFFVRVSEVERILRGDETRRRHDT